VQVRIPPGAPSCEIRTEVPKNDPRSCPLSLARPKAAALHTAIPGLNPGRGTSFSNQGSGIRVGLEYLPLRSIHFSSWPGLSRPSTSWPRRKTWMRGTSPRMTPRFYNSGACCSGPVTVAGRTGRTFNPIGESHIVGSNPTRSSTSGPVTPSGRRHSTLDRAAKAHRRFESSQVLQSSVCTPIGRGNASRAHPVGVRVAPDAPNSSAL
jgi:hypothetical protein